MLEHGLAPDAPEPDGVEMDPGEMELVPGIGYPIGCFLLVMATSIPPAA